MDLLGFNQDTQIIWGGDFNVIFDTKLDADGGNPQLKLNSVTKLLSMIAENDMCDIHRVRYPFSKRYTWRQKTPLKQRRLDYFLISDQLQEQIKTIEIISSVQSDHSTLIMKIGSIRQEAKGQPYWKFNTSLVYDKSFVEMMKSEIVKYDMELSEFNDPRIRWDYLKYRMRRFARRYSIDKARRRREKRKRFRTEG